ncbi:MAG TPA: TonB-dependent receptor [Candidatus Dormibacteraeota bacterium]|nr:TonB-dependent receptor [Candidatus Dormibacteraeota bacterium]
MSTTTRVLTICLLISSATALLFGQGGAYGTILGTVTDNSGAVLANAGVDVTNTATNVTNHVQTSSSGDYTAPSLQPGTYRVTVQVPGFQKSITDNVSLVVAQQARVNVTMKPGAVSEVVEVQGSAVALDTDSAAISQIVTTTQVDQLPINNRNFLSLLFITPGAVQTGGEQNGMRQGQGNAISINGGRPESNNYVLDGLANTDPALSTPAVILSQDAIQEFKVLSDSYSAEYGYSANQVSIVSKSGSNSVHGTVFEFFRNDALDAQSVFPNRPNPPPNPELRQNQFGFVLGGPVYIPKVYDGRNKTFFMANYEGGRIVNGTILSGFVPTPAELSGDFSASGFPAFDLTPGSPCALALGASTPRPCMPGNPATGAAYAGGIMSGITLSNVAQVELNNGVFPAPTPQCVSGGCGPGVNYQAQKGFPLTTNQQTYRVDQDLTKAGKVFFRYTRSDYDNANPQGGYVSPLWSVNTFSEQSRSWTVSHTISLGAQSVNNFRFGHLSAIAIQGSPGISDADIATLNLSGAFTKLPKYAAGIPTLTWGAFTSLDSAATNLNATGSPVNSPTTSDTPTWEFADSFTMIRGKHTLSMGADFRHFVESRNLATNYLGGYGYANNNVLINGSSTGIAGIAGSQCPTPLCGTGNQIADFLLGYYNGASAFTPGPLSNLSSPGNLHHYVFNYFAPFVQDDWKVNSRLTLNLGLRWDWRNIPYEQNNDMFWIDDQNRPGGSHGDGGGGLCFANKALLTNGIAPADGVSNLVYNYCGRRNPQDSAKTPFAPRFGFAFRPFNDNKTVIRGGYGIFQDSSLAREIDNSGDQYPYVLRSSINPTDTTQPSAIQALKSTNQLFPDNTAPAPITPALFGSGFVAVIISDHTRNPYVQQYTLSVQRELAKNTTLEVNYVGNRAVHLLNRTNLNQARPLTGAALSTCQADFALGAAGAAAYSADNCNWFQRKSYPNFGGPGLLNSTWEGYSRYNAGNVKIERRTSDLALLAIYTYAKSLDDKSAPAGIGANGAGFAGHLDESNPRRDYGPSDFDVRHRFVTSAVYQLPFGRGKHFANGSKVADLLVGGWQLGVIATFQKGFPFSVTAPDQGGAFQPGFIPLRADITGQPKLVKNITQWFNTSAFSQGAWGTFGNSGRNNLTQPGINNWDMNLAKTFQFTERVGFQLRLETFNTFNHTQYGVDPNQPNVSAGSSSVNADITAANFGQVTSARPARVVQLGGKITF